jgi:hypothetical protein
MPKSKTLYQADQEVFGKHMQSSEWIMYFGKLTVYDRKTKPVVLKLKGEIYPFYIADFMEEKKEIKGDSISEVFGKIAKWYLKHGIVFQH